MVLAVGAATGLSLAQKKKYTATGSFQFQDESRDLGLVGVQVAPTLTPAQLATQAAQTITQPQVLALVKRDLRSPLSLAALAQDVSSTVDPNANIVNVHASAPTAAEAARRANSFTAAAVRVANQTQRSAYRAAADALARRPPRKSDLSATAAFNDELGRLRALASIASPATVTSSATPPGSPSSPKPVRNAAIAAFLGLLLGLFIVFLWDAFDHRLHSAADVEASLDYPVVGRVRNEALGTSLRAEGGEATVEPIDWEHFQILGRNFEFLAGGDGARVIAVTSAMPEEGKTTVAFFVACAAAATGRRVLLVECDLRRPVIAQRLGLQTAPGVADFVMGQARPQDVLQMFRFGDPASSNGARQAWRKRPTEDLAAGTFRHEIVCITAGSATQHPAELLSSPAFHDMLAQIRPVYDLVVLDTTPLLPVVDALEVIPAADSLLVCARASRLTRDQARAGRDALAKMPERPTGLVITGIRPTRKRGTGYYGYYGYAR